MEASGICIVPLDKSHVTLAKDLTDGGALMLLEPAQRYAVTLTCTDEDGDKDGLHFEFSRPDLEEFLREGLKLLQQG